MEPKTNSRDSVGVDSAGHRACSGPHRLSRRAGKESTMGHHGPKRLLNLMLMLPLLLVVPAVAGAEQIKAHLTGYQEVPVVSTNASGEFRAHISRDDGTI